jgi:hypothetical protein
VWSERIPRGEIKCQLGNTSLKVEQKHFLKTHLPPVPIANVMMTFLSASLLSLCALTTLLKSKLLTIGECSKMNGDFALRTAIPSN